MSKRAEEVKEMIKRAALAVIAVVVAIAVWQIYDFLSSSAESIARTEEIAAIAAGEAGANEDSPEGCPIEAARGRIIDFDALRAQNPEIIAWIYIPKTTVDYAVVQTGNNSFYLNHDAFRRWDSYGAIFMDWAHESDFSLSDTVLYGHHMRNGRKFGLLESYKNQEFRDAHSYIFIYTPEHTRQFAYLSQALSTSTQLEPYEGSDNQVISLVTCDYTPGFSHFIVRAEIYELMFPGGIPVPDWYLEELLWEEEEFENE